MKKKLFALATLVVILAALGTGTLAYFTSNATAHNVITSGEIDIDLVETMKKDGSIEPYPTEPVGGIMPGAAHSKIVEVANTGSNPAWVRVKVDVRINGETVDVNADGSVLSINFNETQWVKIGGYYYYNAVLPAGETTAAPLFTEVEFAGAEMGNEYQNARIEIDVQAYATQSQNNPIPEGGDVSDVKGWPNPIVSALLG